VAVSDVPKSGRPRPSIVSRMVWTVAAIALLTGYTASALWVVPRALAVDSAVRFMQALTTRQDAYNYQRLSDAGAAGEQAARFQAESASVRHDLATRGFGSIDLASATLHMTPQGAIVLMGVVEGAPAEMGVSVQPAGSGRMSVQVQLTGAEAARLPVEVLLSGNFASWKVDAFRIDGKTTLGVRTSDE